MIATGYDATATFSAGTGSESITVTLDTARGIGNLAFSNANYTLAGTNTLTLDVASTPTPAISVASGLTATVSVTLAGTQGLEKTGTGTLTLTGKNTYTGVTTASTGSLVGKDGGAANTTITPFGAGALSIGSAATFTVDNSSATNFNIYGGGAITGNGNITFIGSPVNRLIVGDATNHTFSGFTGTITIGGNTVQMDRANTTAALNIGSGARLRSWSLGGSPTFGALSGSGIIEAVSGGGGNTVTIGNGGADGTFSGTIQNGGYTMSLTKIGSGTQTLSGTNTYSGATIITGGTLLVNGNQATATGGVTVETNATLGGTGTVGGNITVKSGGALAPGAGVGTLNTRGTVTLEPGAVFAAQIDSSSATADQIFAYNNLTITGAVLNLSDIAGSPAALPVGTKLTLIDYETLTLTGTFNGLPEGSTVSAGINSFTLSYNDVSKVTLTAIAVSNPYAGWSGGADFDADANNDGISNGLAFLLGAASPTSADALGLLPKPTTSNGALVLSFKMRNAAARGTAKLNLQYSNSLAPGSWTTVPVPNTTPDPQAANVSFTITPGDPLNTVTATISSSQAANGKLFARCSASEN